MEGNTIEKESKKVKLCKSKTGGLPEELKLSMEEEASEMKIVDDGNEEGERKNKKRKRCQGVADLSGVEGDTGEKESKKVKSSRSKTGGEPEELKVSKAGEASEMKIVEEGNEVEEKKKKVKKGKNFEEVADLSGLEGNTSEKESKKAKSSRSKTGRQPEELKISQAGEASEMKIVEEGNGEEEEEKKKERVKKGKRCKEVADLLGLEGNTSHKESKKVKLSRCKIGGEPGEHKLSEAEEVSEMKIVKKGNEKEKKKGKSHEEVADVLAAEGNTDEKESKTATMSRSKTGEGDPEMLPVETEDGDKNKMRMAKYVENGSKGVWETKTSGKTSDRSNKSKGKSKSKTSSEDVDDLGKELVRGKRFSEQEDEILKKAVFSYIEEHALGEDGLDKILHCKNHPDVRDCWKHIAEALPKRPRQSIYYRAHILFERGESRGWTEEDKELIRNHYKEHGSDWKNLAVDLGKHRFHVKDTWRRIKLARNIGHWSQDEYQNLFDFVNMDLRMKAYEEKKSKHGMLRDNICWGAISDRLSTRTDASCCLKWYAQLTSPMVEEGIWEDADDYRLLDALYSLDDSCIEDVEWDFLVENRSGDVCRRRWGQMINHIGEHGSKSFSEQVEVLSKRYCPELLETREAYDSQPRIP